MRSPSANVVEDSYSAHFHLRLSGSTTDGALPAEGLRMSLGFSHRPVLLEETVRLLLKERTGLVAAGVPGVVIDCTLGGAGHASAMLAADSSIHVLGIDQDPEALEHSRQVLSAWPGRGEAADGRFDDVDNLYARSSFAGEPVVGVLFDLGVSSHQFDIAERGFSYRHDAPIDMRMNRSSGMTGADLLNTASEADLVSLFRDNGEAKFAGRIAKGIVANRPLETTFQLVEVVKAAIPAYARRGGGHPAKRVFQAIRIAVNEELPVLVSAITKSMSLLAPGGRIAVISYHSGEDRIVKSMLRSAVTGDCTCPPGLPCGCGAVPTFKWVVRSTVKPGPAELAANPRSASARLRVAEKLGHPQGGGDDVA